ncbi:MAG: surface-adhesin E family protein [Pseudomonadota bacterium]
MIRSALAAAALTLALPAAAFAQAQAPQERLRLADEGVDDATFSGAPFAANGHVRMWSWTMNKDRSEAAGVTFNTLATLHEFDCQARSLGYVRVEAYLDNAFMLGEDADTDIQPAEAGTVSEVVMGLACDTPNDGDYVGSPAEARAMVTEFFSEQ